MEDYEEIDKLGFCEEAEGVEANEDTEIIDEGE